VDEDSYLTLMEGLKFKVGHRWPRWKRWSYEYPEQQCKGKIIEEALNCLRGSQGTNLSVTS